MVVGTGAREHALIKKFQSENEVSEVLAVGGNAGIEKDVEVLTTELVNVGDVTKVVSKVKPDLVVIGPEAPLVSGMTDSLLEVGVRVFGPSAKAAQLESSKAFAKTVMKSAGVATANSDRCVTLSEVEQALSRRKGPFVVKDDALASGKGVVVTEDIAQAIDHAKSVLVGSGCVLVEDFLVGQEASLFFICDGQNAIPLLPARDHKRLLDDDLGPNTGGMGSFTPLSDFTQDQAELLTDEIARPVLKEMLERGTPFKGLLYAGLMLDGGRAQIVEFNVRFGDPETQSVLAVMTSPLAPLLAAAADGHLAGQSAPQWADAAAVTVVLAAGGYPTQPRLGAVITGIDDAVGLANVVVTHAGTKDVNSPRVNGGRVLSVTATGSNLSTARESVYQAVQKINFEGMQYRTDIAKMQSLDTSK